MHRDVVPPHHQLPGAERSVRLEPVAEDTGDDGVQRGVQSGEAAAEQHAEVDGLRAVVELALIDRQPRGLGERLRQSISVEQVAKVILDASLERSEEHTSELQSRLHLVCRLLLEKKKKKKT